MKNRDAIIGKLKRKANVSSMGDLDEESKKQIPIIPPAIRWVTQQLFLDVVNGLNLIIQQVDRLFTTYSSSHPTVTLVVTIGKWTSDFVEHLFGATRARKGQHDAVTLRDLFRTLKFQQVTGSLFCFFLLQVNSQL